MSPFDDRLGVPSTLHDELLMAGQDVADEPGLTAFVAVLRGAPAGEPQPLPSAELGALLRSGLPARRPARPRSARTVGTRRLRRVGLATAVVMTAEIVAAGAAAAVGVAGVAHLPATPSVVREPAESAVDAVVGAWHDLTGEERTAVPAPPAAPAASGPGRADPAATSGRGRLGAGATGRAESRDGARGGAPRAADDGLHAPGDGPHVPVRGPHAPGHDPQVPDDVPGALRGSPGLPDVTEPSGRGGMSEPGLPRVSDGWRPPQLQGPADDVERQTPAWPTDRSPAAAFAGGTDLTTPALPHLQQGPETAALGAASSQGARSSADRHDTTTSPDHTPPVTSVARSGGWFVHDREVRAVRAPSAVTAPHPTS